MQDVVVKAETKLDAQRLRADFPIFEQTFHGKPLAFLDTAASSQKPRQMLEAMTAFYETSYANVHRGVYQLAERATEALELSREKVRALLNAPSAREVIFVAERDRGHQPRRRTRGALEPRPRRPRRRHRARAPLELRPVAVRRAPDGRGLPHDPAGRERRAASSRIWTRSRARGTSRWSRPAIVSNSLGTMNPVDRLSAWAHEHGAIMVADAAQSAPHMKMDVQALGCDFVAISAHKMCGPSGVGALWGKAELLEAHGAVPDRRAHDPLGRRGRDELGRASAQVRGGHGADGRGGRVRRRDRLPDGGRLRRDRALRARARCLRARAPRGASLGHVYGPSADRRAGIVSFNVEGIHPHDVAQVLDFEGIAIRAGHHCCQPLMRKLGVAATNRASFYLYTIPDEIDRLVEGLHKVRKAFG